MGPGGPRPPEAPPARRQPRPPSNPHSPRRHAALVGPEAKEILRELGIAGDFIDSTRPGTGPNSHMLLAFQNTPVIVARFSGLATEGFTFVADESVVGELWRAIALRGAICAGSVAHERARVLQGRPSGPELTDAHTPLEAGLGFRAVSLSKGCYMGQETLAKVWNLGAHKTELWGLRLQYGASCKPGDEVTDADGARLGTVTSVATDEKGFCWALGYLRCRAGGERVELEGTKVRVGEANAYVEPLEFLGPRDLAEGSRPAAAGGGEGAAAAAAADEDEAEAKRREDKLRRMQERLEAFQKAQQEGQ